MSTLASRRSPAFLRPGTHYFPDPADPSGPFPGQLAKEIPGTNRRVFTGGGYSRNNSILHPPGLPEEFPVWKRQEEWAVDPNVNSP